MEEPNQQRNKPFELIPLTPEQHPVTGLPKRTTELPFFYLTKKKELLQKNITYEGVDESGRPIRWTVRPNRDPEIGVPTIDAHEVWVRLIIPVIEQHRSNGGKIPEILPLGGVRQCLRMLGWGVGGHQARRLLRGLNQIGAAWCEADFFLAIIDSTGQQKFVPIKGKFSRLSIYAIGENHLTGEQLAGGKFDFDFDLDATIYVQLHKLEMAIQDSQERRYIDNQYMFSVEPTGRRWLEIMAPKIFGVVKNNGSHCDVRYSWYVKQHHTLKRHYTRKRVTDQMNHVAEDHIASGYILKPEYLTVKESEQEIDFIVRYKPGPMATQSTSRIRSYLKKSPPTELSAGAGERPARKLHQKKLSPESASAAAVAPIIDYRQVSELGKFGISEADARQLLATLPSDYPTADVLEYAAASISTRGSTIHTPAGFVVDLLRNRKTPPPTFESSRARIAREEAESAKRQAVTDRQMAALEAEEAERQRLDAPIAAMAAEDRQSLFSQAKEALLKERPQMADFFRLHPDSAVEDAAVRKRMREFLASGWKTTQPTPESQNLHYAINPPIRQATPLQEPAPVSATPPGQGSDLQTVADQPQSAKGYRLENLAAILSTPQLQASVEQAAVELAPAAESLSESLVKPDPIW
jgi:hypothetical protein